MAAPSTSSSATRRRRVSPNVRNSANCARRRTTDNACVENTSRPPVNNATSASTLRLTRYARDMRVVASARACGASMASPAGSPDMRRARTPRTSAPGLTRRSMRVRRPTRPNSSCTAATSMTAYRCDDGDWTSPAIVSVTSRSPACSAISSPVCTPSHAAAAGLTNSLSGRSTSSASAVFPVRAGVTAPARKASTPNRDSVSSRPLIRASTSTTGLATAMSGSCARPTKIASSNPERGPRTSRSAFPDSVAMLPANSPIAVWLMSCTAKPSATPSAIASTDSSRRPRLRPSAPPSVAAMTLTRAAPALMALPAAEFRASRPLPASARDRPCPRRRANA